MMRIITILIFTVVLAGCKKDNNSPGGAAPNPPPPDSCAWMSGVLMGNNTSWDANGTPIIDEAQARRDEFCFFEIITLPEIHIRVPGVEDTGYYDIPAASYDGSSLAGGVFLMHNSMTYESKTTQVGGLFITTLYGSNINGTFSFVLINQVDNNDTLVVTNGVFGF